MAAPTLASHSGARFTAALLLGLVGTALASAGLAQVTKSPALPDPVHLEDAIVYARVHRLEIDAARSSARAAGFRPAIVSALPDPVLSLSLDHVPFPARNFDRSMTWEQSLTPSGQRRSRERAARAGATSLSARADRVELDVEYEAMRAFAMLYEARQIYDVTTNQLALARQLVAAAEARYSAGTSNQAEVLRGETEAARIEAELRAVRSEIAATTAMFNGALGRPPDSVVPRLAVRGGDDALLEAGNLEIRAAQARPELAESRAEVMRARAEVEVMESMYSPMWMLRGGPAYTMADGPGVMLMVGVSVPLRRSRLEAGVSEAQFMLRMAEADLDAMALMISAEIAAARERVAAAQARLEGVRDEVVPRARQTLDAWLVLYGAGQSNLIAVIDAAQALWTAQEMEVRAEASLELERAYLARAVGETWGPQQ